MKELIFKDHDGIKYIYNDDTGIIFESNDINNENEYNNYYSSRLNKKINEITTYKNNIEDFKIEDYFLDNGFNQLTFKMTDDCNLRCKYCIYSDHYKYMTGYKKTKLTWEVAKKAVDIYMNNFKNIASINAYRNPTICFYGGEPLLNFDIIEKIVEYIKSNYRHFECSYTITTNGLLLNDKISKFLKGNNFGVCVSIDGTEENHDRNRLKIDNTPSYKQVVENVSLNFKDYHNIYIICCIDYKTDLKNLNQFFSDNYKEKLPPLMRVSIINDSYTDYYEQFTENDIRNFFMSLNDIREEYINNAMMGKENSIFSEKLIGGDLFTLHCRSKFLTNNRFFIHNTSTCVPGDKIYVDTEGNFHICEKINGNFSIGDVEKGLDMRLIKKVILNFNKNILSKCSKCNISRICSMCYASVAASTDFKFEKEDQCIGIIEHKKKLLSDYVQILKHNPQYFEEKYLEENVNKKKNELINGL